MALLALGVAGASVVGIGVGPATASGSSVRGNYSMSFQWSDGPGGTITLTLAKKHEITGELSGGTYTYKKHKLTLNLDGDCGAVYTGSGTPSKGFSGTSVVENNAPSCGPQGTTGVWFTGPKGSTAPNSAVHSTRSASGLR
jgi:hypothetical protein